MCEKLNTELLSKVFAPDKVSELLEETPDMARRREDTIKAVAMLEEANASIHEVQTVSLARAAEEVKRRFASRFCVKSLALHSPTLLHFAVGHI